uniref:Uncharacterized protein n=1 Tax=Hirsutella vermicola TaxID=369263 RepID=A0A1S6KM23_9HYPO|nr:hypothetical protein [Hirsutella vermicola]AQT19617.1 hypothetical protein [Hirsutella vermicola]
MGVVLPSCIRTNNKNKLIVVARFIAYSVVSHKKYVKAFNLKFLNYILLSYNFKIDINNLQVIGSTGNNYLSEVLYCKNSTEQTQEEHSTVDTIAESQQTSKASSSESPDEKLTKKEILDLQDKITKCSEAKMRNEENQEILEKGFILESILPEQAWKSNSYLNALKKEYPLYNNEDPRKNLRDIRDHLFSEYSDLVSDSSTAREKLNEAILKEEELITKKREREITDSESESSPNKRARKDDDQDNGKSGPSAAVGGQGPSSCSSQGDGGNSSCSRNSDQANSFDHNQTYILDIIINLIKIFCGDDEDYMD